MKETRIKLTAEQQQQLPFKTGFEPYTVKFIGRASSEDGDFIELIIFTNDR